MNRITSSSPAALVGKSRIAALAVAVTGALLLVSGCGSTSDQYSFAHKSAAQVNQAMMAAIDRVGSVDYGDTDKASGTSDQVVTEGWVSRSSGMQYIHGSLNGHALTETVELIGRDIYVRGNEFALADYDGASASTASKDAGAWVQVPHGGSGYSSFAADLTMHSISSGLGLNSSMTVTAPSVGANSQRVTMFGTLTPAYIAAMAGSQAKTGAITVMVTAQSQPLPTQVIYDIHIPGSVVTSNVRFRDWGVGQGHLSAPKHYLPGSSTFKG